MNRLQVIEKENQRVLTTSQLAESYGADVKTISNNFNRNKERYTEGKHFFLLQGEELKDFKAIHQKDEQLKFATKLYIWTEKGAWLHAKSLNTDEAWEAYEILVDEYYRITKQFDTSQLSPELQMFQTLFTTLATQELNQKKLEQKVDNISEIVALNSTDWRRDTTTILNKIARKQGGFEMYRKIRNESYEILEQRASAKLSIRVNNKKKSMALEGVSKSKIDKVSNLDIIGEEKRLLEIYLAIVKEMAIRYQVSINEAI